MALMSKLRANRRFEANKDQEEDKEGRDAVAKWREGGELSFFKFFVAR